VGSDGLLRYKYRGSDPAHRDNIGLREAMRRHLPLVYLHGIVEGRYMGSWPVFIVGDDPASLTFTVAVDERQLAPLLRQALLRRRRSRSDAVTSPAWSANGPTNRRSESGCSKPTVSIARFAACDTTSC
jgi:hypothetical protein